MGLCLQFLVCRVSTEGRLVGGVCGGGSRARLSLDEGSLSFGVNAHFASYVHNAAHIRPIKNVRMHAHLHMRAIL